MELHTGAHLGQILRQAARYRVDLTKPLSTLTLDMLEYTLAKSTPTALTPPTYERR